MKWEEMERIKNLPDTEKKVLLNDIYGQGNTVKKLVSIIGRCRNLNVKMSNVLFVGYDVSQAERLALAVSNELGTRINCCDYSLNASIDAVKILIHSSPGDIVFIDVDQQKVSVLEVLYRAFKDNLIEIIEKDGGSGTKRRIPISQLVYIFYCNRSSDIPLDIIEKIPEVFALKELSYDEREDAIKKYCTFHNVRIDGEAVKQIADAFQSWIQLEKYLVFLYQNVVGEKGRIDLNVIAETSGYAKRLGNLNGISIFADDNAFPVLDKHVQIFSYILSEEGAYIRQPTSFHALIKEYFYKDILLANLLFIAVDMGIVSAIEQEKSLDNSFIKKYSKQMVQYYGVKPNLAIWAITMWAQCYGKNILGKEYRVF